MTVGRESLRAFWDGKAERDAQTGFEDRLLYRYDQPLRLRLVRATIAKLYPGGFGGRTAMDVGCGTGDFARLWAEQGAGCVYAVDISPAVVAIARERLAVFPQIRVRTGAVQDSAAAADAVDAVTSITVLQHIVDDDEAVAAIRGLAGALKPDGYFIALEISPRDRVAPSMPGLLKERTVAEWLNLFAEGGFVQLRPPAVYSPLGFTVVQLWIPGVLRRVLGPAWNAIRSRPESSGEAGAAAWHGRVLRGLYACVRALLLAAAYPVDRLCQLRVPERQAYYHLFVMRRAR